MDGESRRQHQVHNSSGRHDSPSAGDFGVIADEITCQQFVELVTDYLEGALGPRTLSRAEEHLVLCDPCVAYLEQMKATIGSLRELKERGAPEPPDAVLAALRAKRKA